MKQKPNKYPKKTRGGGAEPPISTQVDGYSFYDDFVKPLFAEVPERPERANCPERAEKHPQNRFWGYQH